MIEFVCVLFVCLFVCVYVCVTRERERDSHLLPPPIFTVNKTMSSNPQWKSFQPPPSMNQDSTILDFKSMTVPSNGKSPQSFNFRSNSYSSGDYNSTSNNAATVTATTGVNMMDKSTSNNYGSSYSSTSNSANSRTSARFPIGTFSLDSNNMFNNTSTSSNNSSGDALSSPSNNTVFTNGNSSSYDSNSANLGTRETGIIEKLLHSYGFIQCCERQARLFFHFSQFSGNIEHLKIGDPVEFEMTYDRRTGKPIASTVTKIAPEVVLSEERVTGNVTTELRTDGSAGDTQGRISYENRGECFFLPYTKDDVEGNVTLRAGDKVSFQIATNQR